MTTRFPSAAHRIRRLVIASATATAVALSSLPGAFAQNGPDDYMEADCHHAGGVYSGGICRHPRTGDRLPVDRERSATPSLGQVLTAGVVAIIVCGALGCFDDEERRR